MPKRKPKFRIYKGENGLWYWELKASNSRTIAIPDKGYQNHDDAANAHELLVGVASTAEVDDSEYEEFH